MRLIIGLVTSAAMLPMAIPVAAQVAAPAPATTAEPDTGGDIVVTARLRNETLQDVPIAVTAFSERDLVRQQVDNVRDLNAVVPSLSITQITGGGVAQIYLRGAGQDDSQAASEPPITIYVDGVPYTKAPGALLDIIEFDRIEVLRGPQGTLYGRNSTGGAISFITKRPSLDRTTFVGDVTVGSFRRIDIRGAVSTPLTPNFAVKLDFISRNQNGYVRDALAATGNNRPVRYNDTSRQVLRLSALWEPGDAMRVFAAFDYTRDNGGPQSGTPAISSEVSANVRNGAISQARTIYGARLAAPTLFDSQTFTGRGLVVNVTHDLPGVTLTGIFGYRGFDLSQGTDTDSGPNVTSVDQNGATVVRGFGSDYVRNWSNDTFTLELRAASSGTGPFTWVAGVFGMHEKNYSDDIFGRFSEPAASQVASQFLFDQTTKSVAVFGEASYAIVPTVTVSAGGRFTYDRKDVSRIHRAALGRPVLSGAPYATATSADWSQFTPRVILDWKPTSAINLYASYSRGFQAGAFQSFPFSVTTANQPFNPTKVGSYEVGIKTQFFNNRLTANLTAFRASYTDLPSTITASQGTFIVLTNDVRLQGLELEVRARPLPCLELSFIGGITGDRFDRSVVAASAVPGATANRLKFVADNTARLGATYTLPVSDTANVRVTGNLTHSGDFFMSTVNTPFAYQKAYTLLGGEIGYDAGDGRFEFAVGARNLTDQLYQERASTGGGGVIYFGPPRTLYARVKYRL